jgi:hypothetical protein
MKTPTESARFNPPCDRHGQKRLILRLGLNHAGFLILQGLEEADFGSSFWTVRL